MSHIESGQMHHFFEFSWIGKVLLFILDKFDQLIYFLIDELSNSVHSNSLIFVSENGVVKIGDLKQFWSQNMSRIIWILFERQKFKQSLNKIDVSVIEWGCGNRGASVIGYYFAVLLVEESISADSGSLFELSNIELVVAFSISDGTVIRQSSSGHSQKSFILEKHHERYLNVSFVASYWEKIVQVFEFQRCLQKSRMFVFDSFMEKV